MIFSEWIRKIGFWTLDFLTGSKVRKHFVDVKNIMENGADPNVSKIQDNYLNSILKYATGNVEFYKKFSGLDSIGSFPVINKNIIRNNYAAFQSPEFLKAAVVNMHTSGSTGTPFVVRQDKNKRDRVYAEMMYFWGTAGYQIGMKYAFFRIWTSINRQSKVSAWARNVIMIDIQDLDDEKLENIRNFIKAGRNIRMLLGYASTLDDLANYCLACGDHPGTFPNIQTIIGFGEAFPENTHKKLKDIFDCNVISLYSNQENGMLAVECVENKEFHVNSASYYIELLKMDSDEPAEVGEPGRVVITDLFNYAMPLIRYENGDNGVWKKDVECGWQTKALYSLSGSASDLLFDTKGNKKTADTIIVKMWSYDKIFQFQVIQEGAKQYVLKLNGAEGCYGDAIFIDLVKESFGQDAEVIIQYVHEIPVLASGKRKTAVNNYKK